MVRLAAQTHDTNWRLRSIETNASREIRGNTTAGENRLRKRQSASPAAPKENHLLSDLLHNRKSKVEILKITNLPLYFAERTRT